MDGAEELMLQPPARIDILVRFDRARDQQNSRTTLSPDLVDRPPVTVLEPWEALGQESDRQRHQLVYQPPGLESPAGMSSNISAASSHTVWRSDREFDAVCAFLVLVGMGRRGRAGVLGLPAPAPNGGPAGSELSGQVADGADGQAATDLLLQ